jgi:hypothetical protein
MSDLRAVTVDYPFTEDEARTANSEWHCNCGPAALAFALQIGLDKVRAALAPTGFEQRRYTSPTMMREALANLDQDFDAVRNPHGGRNYKAGVQSMFSTDNHIALVRIQWTGPWAADGKTQKWAARQTHWITCWRNAGSWPCVFDINGGVRLFDSWEREIVPLIVAEYPRADGGWYPANVWRLK